MHKADARSRTGHISVAGTQYPARVELRVAPQPGRETMAPLVEVVFLAAAPSGPSLMASAEHVFLDSEGAKWILQYTGRAWRLRDPAGFLG